MAALGFTLISNFNIILFVKIELTIKGSSSDLPY